MSTSVPSDSIVTISDNSPITIGEFVIKESKRYSCVQPTASLQARCQAAGGEITINLTSMWFASRYTLGCYPGGRTKDAGKKCSNDKQCEGECIWLHWDAISWDDSDTCSEYKKPFFIFPDFAPGDYVCN